MNKFKIINNTKNEEKIIISQDTELFKLHKSVKKNLNLSHQIYNELNKQEDIINNFENNVDNSIYKIKHLDKEANSIMIKEENTCCILL